MAKKSNNKVNEINSLLLVGIISLIAGIVGTYYYQKINRQEPEKKIEYNQSSAEVRQIAGLYVFINSKPLKETEYIDMYQTDIAQTIQKLFDFKGKNLWDKIGDIGKTFDFDQKLKENIEKVKNKYPEAQLVVFDDRIDQCQVLKYK